MNSRTRTRLRQDFPQGWWHSPRWWGGAVKQDVGMVLTTFAPVLLLHKAVFAVRHRASPVKLARINIEAFTYGLVACMVVLGVTVWALAGQSSSLPVLLGLGGFQLLNVLVAGTVVTVVAISRIRERAAWSAIDFVERNHAGSEQAPQTPRKYAAEPMKALIAE